MVATRTAPPSPSHAPPAPTREMADWIAGVSHEDITMQALTWAQTRGAGLARRHYCGSP